jgi:hypothetical protein
VKQFGGIGTPAGCAYVTAGILAFSCAAVIPTGFDIATNEGTEGLKYLFGWEY